MQRLLFPLIGRMLRRSYVTPTKSMSPRPDAPPYAWRGSFSVGTREFIIPDRQRPLQLTIWYPAHNPNNRAQIATYFDGPVKFEGRALTNAPFERDAAPYPLVIFSHGSGGVRLQSLFLTEHLASYGFVVMSVNHSGNTVYDGMLAPDQYEVNRLRNYILRPNDVLRQIAFAETLTASDGEMPGLIDMERIAITGHSFGGYTALAVGGARLNFDALNEWCADPKNAELDASALGTVSYLRHHVELFAELRNLDTIPQGLWEPTADERVRAIAAFAPYNAPIFGADGLACVSVPALIIVGSDDPITIPERDAYVMYEYLGSTSKYMMVLENAGHFVFVDECSELLRHFNMFEVCSDKVWDMARTHDLTNHMTTAFLLAKIYNDRDAAHALAPSMVDFKGVRYETTGHKVLPDK